ncbi:unnamed protein product [Closterium sp. NIES-64]|nr:unnamed protein product [Closterium sp. NIES-64]
MAAASSQTADQEWLLCRLRECLDPGNTNRVVAEEALRQAEAMAAAVLLRQVVQRHWQAGDEEEEGEGRGKKFTVSPEDKAAVRALLLQGLVDEEPKVQSAVGLAIAHVASCDWPEVWPELMDHLMAALADTAHPNRVAAAVECLSLFAEEIDDAQLPALVPKLFPPIFAIVSNPNQAYRPSARRGALSVLRATVATLGIMSAVYQEESKAIISESLPAWVAQFAAILSSPLSQQDPQDWGIRKEVLRCLTQLIQHFPALLESTMPGILAALWQSYVSGIPLYERLLVAGLPLLPPAAAAAGDAGAAGVAASSDNAQAGAGAGGAAEGGGDGGEGYESAADELSALAIQAFEFLLTLATNSRFQKGLQGTTEALVYFAIAYMQITATQEEEWQRDTNEFVSEEDDEAISCRTSAAALLEELVAEFKDEAVQGISTAVQRRLGDTVVNPTEHAPAWWKLREAAIFAAGSVADTFLQYEMEGKPVFDSKAFLDALLLHDLGPNGAVNFPFLYCRCLWAAASLRDFFSPLRVRVVGHQAPTEKKVQLLRVAAEALSQDRLLVIRIGACRALSRLAPNMSFMPSPLPVLLHTATMHACRPLVIRIGACRALSRLAPNMSFMPSPLPVLLHTATMHACRPLVIRIGACRALSRLAPNMSFMPSPLPVLLHTATMHACRPLVIRIGACRALSRLAPNTPLVIRIGACRALSRLAPNMQAEDLRPVLPAIYTGISHMLPEVSHMLPEVSHMLPEVSHMLLEVRPMLPEVRPMLPEVSDDTLHLALELLTAVVRSDAEVTAQMEPVVTSALLGIWAEHVNDPVISSDTSDALEAMADLPACIDSILRKAIPPLSTIFSKPEEQPNGLVAGGMELLTMLLKRTPPPLVRPVFDALFAPLAAVVLQSDDHTELQNGAEALAMFVRKGGEELVAGSADPDATMKTLLDAAAKLLSPQLEPSASLFVGPLLVQLIRRVPSRMAPHLQALVAAIVHRMAAKRMPSLSVSLLLVFARLVHWASPDVRPLLDLLSSMPLPSHPSALHFLLSEWAMYHRDIHGVYHSKVASAALALLLASRDPRLLQVPVQGRLVATSKGVVTRSRARVVADKWTEMAFPAKGLSLLAGVLLEAKEEGEQADALRGDGDIDEEDEEGSEEEGGHGKGREGLDAGLPPVFASAELFSHLLDQEFGEDAGDDDDDAQDDPLNQINLPVLIADVIRQLATQDPSLFHTLSQELTAKERSTIQTTLNAS